MIDIRAKRDRRNSLSQQMAPMTDRKKEGPKTRSRFRNFVPEQWSGVAVPQKVNGKPGRGDDQ